MRMRAKLTLALLFLAALPIVIVLTINVRDVLRFEEGIRLQIERELEERNRMLRSYGQANQRLAGKTAFNFNKRFAEMDRELRRVGGKKDIIGTMKINAQDGLLKKFVKTNREVTGLEVLSEKGTVINLHPLDKKRIKARDNLANTPGFQRLFENEWKRSIGEVRQTDAGSEVSLLVGMTRKGKRFALRANIDLRAFIGKVKPEPQGDVFLVNNEKFYIAHQDKKQIFKRFNPDDLPYLNDVMTDLEAKRAGYRVTYYQGRACVISYAPLKVGGWGVGILVSPGDALALAQPAHLYSHFLSRPALFIPALLLLVIMVSTPLVALWGARTYQELGRRLKQARAGKGDIGEEAEGELGELLGDIQGLLTSTRQGMERDLAGMATGGDGTSVAGVDAELQKELENHRERLEEKLKELDALRVVSETLRQDKRKSEEKVVGLEGELEKLRQVEGATAGGAAKLKDSAVIEIMSEMDSVVSELREFISNSLGADDLTPEQRSQALSGLVGKSAGLEKLVSEVQEYYSLDAAGARVVVDLNEVLEGVILDVGAQAEAKGVNAEQELSEERLEVMANRGQLAHALRLLAEAGVKVSPASSTIAFASAREGDSALLRVRFSGVEVPAGKERETLFRDYQGRESAFAGSGLMLPTAMMIIETHGGDIALAGEPGAGTEFKISLPLSGAAAAAGEEKGDAALAGAEGAVGIAIPGMDEIAKELGGGAEGVSPAAALEIGETVTPTDQVEVLDINPPVPEAVAESGAASVGLQPTALPIVDEGETGSPAVDLDALSAAPPPAVDLAASAAEGEQDAGPVGEEISLDSGDDLGAAIAEAAGAIGATPGEQEPSAEPGFDPSAFESAMEAAAPGETGGVADAAETVTSAAGAAAPGEETDGGAAFDPSAFEAASGVDQGAAPPEAGMVGADTPGTGEAVFDPTMFETPAASASAEAAAEAAPAEGKSDDLDFSDFK